MPDEPQEEKKHLSVEEMDAIVAIEKKKAKNDNLKFFAIIGLVGLMMLIMTFMYAPFMFSLVGVQIWVYALFGMGIGLGLGMPMFNPYTKVKILNFINKKKNYHLVEMQISGRRIKTFIVETADNPTVDIGHRSFILDKDLVYMKNEVPCIHYNDLQALPISFEVEKGKGKSDPSLIYTSMIRKRELETLNASKFSKNLMMLVGICTVLSLLAVIAGALSYFQLGDLSRAIGGLVQAAVK